MWNAPFNWKEPISEAGELMEGYSFAQDSGTAPMVIDVDEINWMKAVQYMIGYAQVSNSALIPSFYAPSGSGLLGLQRRLPATHPEFPVMRVTKLMSVLGRGPLDKQPATLIFNGTWGRWKTYRFRVLCEQPLYPMCTDADVQTLGEYGRFVIRNSRVNLDVISRKGNEFKFINPRVADQGSYLPYANSRMQSPTDLIERIPKTLIEWKWHCVPEDYLMYNKLLPTNLIRAVGTVNMFPFPYYTPVPLGVNYAALRHPQTGLVRGVTQFGPGTLLFLPPEITPAVQWTPAMLNGIRNPQLNSTLFPRTYDVVLRWLHFDPWSFDNTTVQCFSIPVGLSGAFNGSIAQVQQQAVTVLDANGGIHALPANATAIVLIRGHNLVPIVVAKAPFDVPGDIGVAIGAGNKPSKWFAAVKGSGVAGANFTTQIGNGVVRSDDQCLYPYFDHEWIFQKAQDWNLLSVQYNAFDPNPPGDGGVPPVPLPP
jgi:hypothetical protein